MGELYLCPTPIGNLEDITLRTIRILKEVDIIAAEDTRHSLKLLQHLGINKPLTSYHEHNKYKKIDYIIEKLNSGNNIALVTDAGTPAISDPGEELVKKCIELGINVVALPGATASITALIISGFNTKGFIFEGFLPTDKKSRIKILERNKNEERTLIFYEAPHRLIETLNIMLDNFGNRNIAVCKELTKLHEEVIRGTIEEVLEIFNSSDKIRGEFVLVLEGKSSELINEEKIKKFSEIDINTHMMMYTSNGMSEKDAMKIVAKERGMKKREVYSILKGDQDE